MLIALHYSRKDYEQAIRLCNWLDELGPFPNHLLLTLRDSKVEPIAFHSSFGGTPLEIEISDDVEQSWPSSANHAFKKAGKAIEYGRRQPFFWMEVDTIPFRASAFDEIEAEYRAKGKPFLGVLKTTTDVPPVPKMSGMGVYAPQLCELAGTVYQAFDIPWDVLAASEIVPRMAQSELMVDAWRADPFTSWAEVEETILSRCPKCAVFHSDKAGSLISLLRARKNNLPVPALAEIPPIVTTAPKAERLVGRGNEARESAQPLPTVERGSDDTLVTTADSCGGQFISNQPPWANRDESVAEIERLAARLHEFQTNVAYVRYVRTLLKEAGVIKLPKRKKRRSQRKPSHDHTNGI